MREILTALKHRGLFTVVGGPWVSVEENYFDGLADVIFVGEAEETWPRFLDEWAQGRHAYRYEQAEKTDSSIAQLSQAAAHDLANRAELRGDLRLRLAQLDDARSRGLRHEKARETFDRRAQRHVLADREHAPHVARESPRQDTGERG